MAEWGIAMSHYRELWDPPTEDDLRIGLEAAQQGLSMTPKTQRERDYLGAIQVFYQNAGSESHSVRAKRYETAMESLHSRYPQDSEAAIFYALSLIANAPLNDKTYANQKKATQILEPIFLQQPEHPGLAHYIIHADDNAALAQHGFECGAALFPDCAGLASRPSYALSCFYEARFMGRLHCLKPRLGRQRAQTKGWLATSYTLWITWFMRICKPDV